MLTVHVRVSDATGRPTPVRVRFSDAAGTYFPPFGRLAEFGPDPAASGGNLRLGGRAFACIDGTCEVRLPPGPVRAEVHKGPEYAPVDRLVTLGAGQISLRLTVDRRFDPAADGWYAGDTRVLDLPPHAALLEGAAEGLTFVNLLARETPPRDGRPPTTPNLTAFSGTTPAVEGGGCQVIVNTLNTHPLLGTLSLLNCHRTVYPLRFGGPDLADDWSVCDWCDQCHRKKGLVVWPDYPRLRPDEPQLEALCAALLGKIDAFELAGPDFDAYHRLLNAGCRLALVGGSGKERTDQVVGGVRTYARLPSGSAPTYADWIEAVRAGRTFATTGPLLTFQVDGIGPGETLRLPAGGRAVTVAVAGRSVAPFDRLELLQDGVAVAQAPSDATGCSARLEVQVPVVRSGWLAAACRGPAGFAHTSPVWLEVEGAAQADPAAARALLDEVLQPAARRFLAAARCDDGHRERLVAIFRQAAARLQGFGGKDEG